MNANLGNYIVCIGISEDRSCFLPLFVIVQKQLLGKKKIIIRFSGPAACTKKSAHKPFFPCPIKKTHPRLIQHAGAPRFLKS